jgi:hypothetical protein
LTTFHVEVSPTHLAKVILTLGLDLLPIHVGFYLFLGTIPSIIALKTNTGCSWMVRLKDVNGRTAMDQGQPGFATGHQIKISYFLTFKVIIYSRIHPGRCINNIEEATLKNGKGDSSSSSKSLLSYKQLQWSLHRLRKTK